MTYSDVATAIAESKKRMEEAGVNIYMCYMNRSIWEQVGMPHEVEGVLIAPVTEEEWLMLFQGGNNG